MKPEGRNFKFNCQDLRLGDLLRRLAYDFSIVLTDLFFVPAFMVLYMSAVSCLPDNIATDFHEESGDVEAVQDTAAVEKKDIIETIVELSAVGTAGVVDELGEMVDALDVFVYDERGIRELESHTRLGIEDVVVMDGKECLFVESGSGGPKTVVVVANCLRTFNLKALAKMDSMELLEYEFSDDNPSKPLMSGTVVIKPGGRDAVTLRPLMCEVLVNSVSNGLDDYELLENPSVRLCDMTPSAKILQVREFRPKEVISNGAVSNLPYDVGFYTQRPGISLWCYPNDTPENILGSPHTSMEFNCRILGEDYVFPVSLPPLERGSRTKVDIIINGPDDYNCKAYRD